MLTLSGIVVVFLLGYWSGWKMCEARELVVQRPLLEAFEDLRSTVLNRQCSHCGSTRIMVAEVEPGKRTRFCGDCLEPVL